MISHQRTLLAVVCLCLGFSGCNRGPERDATAPVTGTVTLNNAPLKQGTIIFLPAKGRQATGKIQDGKIVEVTTYEPGDGALLGSHQVTIAASSGDDMYAKQEKTLPARYADPKTSGLTAEIKADSPNELEYKLTP